jgi:anti-sigma B factor antagonist
MSMVKRQISEITVLQLHGKLTVEGGAQELRDAVRELVPEGHIRVLLHLGGVTYMDSTGVDSLVSSYTTLVRAGGQMKLTNLTRRVRQLLEMTRLLTVFEAYEDQEEALKTFGH